MLYVYIMRKLNEKSLQTSPSLAYQESPSNSCRYMKAFFTTYSPDIRGLAQDCGNSSAWVTTVFCKAIDVEYQLFTLYIAIHIHFRLP